MANNLRYLLEHFCLDGQKIDISSQLDEENANNIEKINTQTVPNINARIDDIKNTDIPNINRRIDSIKNTDIPSINQKINTINITTIPSIQASVTAVDEKADRINASVEKNTRDISTLSDNVTMQGNAINSINTEKIPSMENNISELTTKVGANTNSINTINNTSIPNLQNQIDSLSSGGSGSLDDLREKIQTNTNDISSLSGKVDKNTSDISTLSGKVDTNTSAISTINNTSIPNLQSEVNNIKGSLNFRWSKVLSQYRTTKGFIVDMYVNEKIGLASIYAYCTAPQSVVDGGTLIDTIPDLNKYKPWQTVSSPVNIISGHVENLHGILTVYKGTELTLSFTMSTFAYNAEFSASVLYLF